MSPQEHQHQHQHQHQARTTSSKLGAYFSQLNPVPGFPDYTGPHKVGTVDVEIPVSELDSPSAAPSNAGHIHTVQFRIFYPAAPNTSGNQVNWLPGPQRSYVAAYSQFLGLQPLVAGIVSFLPRHLHYTTIPAYKNADLLEPDTENGRWPTMIFSHGLGGNRNTYSAFAGSLASHGIIVICPEHRDGSAITSFIRNPDAQDSFGQSIRQQIAYNRLPHEVNPEIYLAREEQLRIRLWELGLVHSAVLTIDDQRHPLSNLSRSSRALSHLADRMHVHEPGSIIFAGHSFGSATVVQFLKSTYYADTPALAAMENPLFVPDLDSDIRRQITERNVTMLLDMWCFPLLAPNSAPLFDLPLPAYADVPSAPGGTALLAVESEAFHKWSEHLHVTARVLSPDPSARVVAADSFQRPDTGLRLPEPNFFYVEQSAHLSQSDFGVLFPWLTRRIFNAVEPARALRLNLRAQLEVLRANGVPVARTWVGDLVDGIGAVKDDIRLPSDAGEGGAKGSHEGICDDSAILGRGGEGEIDCWRWIDCIGMGDHRAADATAGEDVSKDVADVEESAPDMEGQIDPSTESPPLRGAVLTTII